MLRSSPMRGRPVTCPWPRDAVRRSRARRAIRQPGSGRRLRAGSGRLSPAPGGPVPAPGGPRAGSGRLSPDLAVPSNLARQRSGAWYPPFRPESPATGSVAIIETPHDTRADGLALSPPTDRVRAGPNTGGLPRTPSVGGRLSGAISGLPRTRSVSGQLPAPPACYHALHRYVANQGPAGRRYVANQGPAGRRYVANQGPAGRRYVANQGPAPHRRYVANQGPARGAGTWRTRGPRGAGPRRLSPRWSPGPCPSASRAPSSRGSPGSRGPSGPAPP